MQDLDTAKELEETFGNYAVIATSEGSNTGSSGKSFETGSRSRGSNTSYHEIRRPLIRREDLMNDCRTDETFIVIRGAKPLRCGRAIYFPPARTCCKDLRKQVQFRIGRCRLSSLKLNDGEIVMSREAASADLQAAAYWKDVAQSDRSEITVAVEKVGELTTAARQEEKESGETHRRARKLSLG